MGIFYVTSFRNLTITDEVVGYVELLPRVNITNDPAVRKRWMTSELYQAAGVIEASHLQSESNLVFGEFDAEEMEGVFPGAYLALILSWVAGLFESAWLLTDHAMACEAAFLRSENSAGATWTSNFLAVRPSFADGYSTEERSIQMSVEDLKTWSRTDDLIHGYLSEKDSSSLRFMMEKGYSRSGRALHFVAAARGSLNLAFKISNYCSALETLFTTESTELAHKLSERVAFFLGARGHNRRAVFTVIKRAYSVRSKLVHGDTLKPSQIEELPALSSQCDEYLREILRYIFNDDLKKVFDSHDSAVEEYFSGLILGM